MWDGFTERICPEHKCLGYLHIPVIMESEVFGSPSDNTLKGKITVQSIRELSRNFLEKNLFLKPDLMQVNASVSKYTLNLIFYKNIFL